jgi:tRNA threonylcarbamoyl adenosine modification protein YeaZ
MRLLALETATLAGGAALLEDGRLVGESRLNIQLTHSERVLAVVDRLLQDCAWEIASLRGLAVSIGPGSFTGLRVGAATAKGLALALDVPVAPVPTLDALAATLPFADAPVVPLLAARKNEVYCSLYRWRDGAMAREWDYLALPPAEAAGRLPAALDAPERGRSRGAARAVAAVARGGGRPRPRDAGRGRGHPGRAARPPLPPALRGGAAGAPWVSRRCATTRS